MAASYECVPELTARLKELTRNCRKEELVLVSMTPIQSLTTAFKEQHNRMEATQSLFESFEHILATQLAEIEVFTDNPDRSRNGQLEACLQLVAECFRCLRNACIQCVKNQSHASFCIAIRCGLQFLGNLITGNEESKHILWKSAFPDLFMQYLSQSDKKTVTYCCMVLFTCLNAERTADLLSHTKGVELAEAVVKICKKEPELDWAYVLFEQHLKYCLNYLNWKEALIVIRLLDILCETTSNYEKFSYLQNSPGLLETVVDLLDQTHLAGKQHENIFSVSQSLSFTDHTFHPAVGFKAHLIHLIGNLCYHNNENQDKVRELGGIPVILDNCSIDDNNPFVSQWAVFTIRILTEQNMKNQEVISQMSYQGVADSAMLNNMGLQVEERDGKLYVKSHGKSS
ncbi:ataxin-10 [Rhincodon typus]|uniref:ataxin-10 n=1 Tax=Rhincodon typus TaxID=259920 RepID=UPI00202E0148|nr:ataxin-10 [Rhincodon typus]